MSGFLFFNYKKSFSIVLLALWDASYQITAADIEEAGRQSDGDGGLYANSNLGRSIVNDYFNLPQPKKLMFLSEMMLSQWDNLLKPYSSSSCEEWR